MAWLMVPAMIAVWTFTAAWMVAYAKVGAEW